MKTFVVGYVNWFDNDLILETVQAESWNIAVTKHSHYPWAGNASADDTLKLPLELIHESGYTDATPVELFKHICFDTDCMMSWVEVAGIEVIDLPLIERWAFLGWFAGGKVTVRQYENRPDEVHMGKCECEQVPFRSFWLEKMVKLGWFTVTKTETYLTKEEPVEQVNIYKIEVTDKGHAVWKEYNHR